MFNSILSSKYKKQTEPDVLFYVYSYLQSAFKVFLIRNTNEYFFIKRFFLSVFPEGFTGEQQIVWSQTIFYGLGAVGKSYNTRLVHVSIKIAKTWLNKEKR